MSLSETAEAYSGSFMHKHAIELALRLIENRRYEGVVLRPVNGYVICLRGENWKTAFYTHMGEKTKYKAGILKYV